MPRRQHPLRIANYSFLFNDLEREEKERRIQADVDLFGEITRPKGPVVPPQPNLPEPRKNASSGWWDTIKNVWSDDRTFGEQVFGEDKTWQDRLQKVMSPFDAVAEVGLQTFQGTRVHDYAKFMFDPTAAARDAAKKITGEKPPSTPKPLINTPNLDTELSPENITQEVERLQAVHERRPLSEQVMGGILFDPLVFGGTSKGAAKILSDITGKFSYIKNAPERLRELTLAEHVRRDAVRKRALDVRGEMLIPPLDSIAETLYGHQPTFKHLSKAPLVSTMYRQIDPLADLENYPLASTQYLGRLGKLIMTKANKKIEANVTTVRSFLDGMGRPEDIFGVWSRDIPEPVAFTRSVNQRFKELGYKGAPEGVFAYGVRWNSNDELIDPPFIADVIEQPGLYHLTPTQTEWIKAYSRIVEDMRAMMMEYGIKVEDARVAFGLTNYVPRVKRDARGNLEIDPHNLSRPDNIDEPRIRETLMETMMETGSVYDPVYDATMGYIRNGYRRILQTQLQGIVAPISRKMEVNQELVKAEKVALRDYNKARNVNEKLSEVIAGKRIFKGGDFKQQRSLPIASH